MPTLITGVTGQDGSYLAEQLAAADERLLGLVHPHAPLPPYVQALADAGSLELVPCDLADPAAFRHLLRESMPRRVFHFAALAVPAQCERDPAASRQVNVVSCEVLLEWQRRDNPAARTLLVSSAAVFGEPLEQPQSEETPPNPAGEYGRQKQAVRELAAAARANGQFAACAIAFNHESERRTEDFVFAKVCRSAARIARGRQERFELGALDPRRDWGYAPEYVQAMAWMLDVDRPLELVLGAGEARSVGELVEYACRAAGLDPGQYMPAQAAVTAGHVPGASISCADPRRAVQELGWEATTKFAALVERLTQHALAELEQA